MDAAEQVVMRAVLKGMDTATLVPFKQALTDLIIKAVPDLHDVNERAAELAEARAGELIRDLTAEQRLVVQTMVKKAIERGWTDAQLQMRLKDKIGLGPRYSAAVENQRNQNLAKGMMPGTANRLASQYAKRLRSQRALTIARYEVQKALNDANRELWLEQQQDGDLTPYAVRIFKTHPDEHRCGVCKRLNGRRVSLKDAAIAPPLHPNCRCWEELSDEGIVKSRSDIRKDRVRTPAGSRKYHLPIGAVIPNRPDRVLPWRGGRRGGWAGFVRQQIAASGGFSVHRTTGVSPAKGYMVAVDNKDSELALIGDDLNSTVMRRFLERNRDRLKDPMMYLGGWFNTETGEIVLDISERLDDLDLAMEVGKKRKQTAIYDLNTGQEVLVKGQKVWVYIPLDKHRGPVENVALLTRAIRELTTGGRP